MTEDEMIGWHPIIGWHLRNEHQFEQTLADGDGQGSLVQSMRSQRVRHGIATEQ